MDARRGEKLGWTLGWLGSSIWLLLAALGFFAGGQWIYGLCALGFYLMVIASMVHLAPWKHPRTRLWRLALPGFAVIVFAASLFISLENRQGSRWDDLRHLGAMFISVLLMGLTMGRRRWGDHATPDSRAGAADRTPAS